MRFAKIVTGGAVAMTGLLLGWGPTAANAAPAAKATSPLDRGVCGTGSEPDLGHVNFHRAGDTVSARVHLQGAQPDSRYLVGDYQVGGPNGCSIMFTIEIFTNSNGVANGTVQFIPSGPMFGVVAAPEGFVEGSAFTPVVSLS
jgi:hypothetical protein